LLPEIRTTAEEAWGVPLGNMWGASEGGGIGIPCAHSRSHLSEDLVIIEPVDEDGRPVAPGERSAKMYLTNLFNRALPLIRYEITDEVTILSDPCPCGSAHRCVADIQGRLDDVFVYDGLRVHPHVFRSVLGLHAGVVEYQVRQTPRGARIAVSCGAPVDLERLRYEIAEALGGIGLPRPVITVTTAERLERDTGAAKLKRFVPLVEPSRPPRESAERVPAAAHYN
jgi:phenylacetate-coenzyme A ligase PaaK-like adenylate-forming protein